ncbi:MAG: 4Fe-4S binding protein [Deltaproteobacteria bacterium]|nr:4Fe-4S binding protein [Deltaproteobacteria bacterium]MBW2306601.1 4Fe-4S binding protein [Deltaproteobacteria bacterium]
MIDEIYCKGCNICIDQCPKKVFENSSKRNPKGYLVPEVSHAENCIGCLLCEMICPDMAITVEDFDDEKRS